MILGIRPEYFHPKNAALPSQTTALLTITPERIEQMGSEQWVYFTVAGHASLAKLPPQETYTVGDPTDLMLDFAQVSVFDPQTELRWDPKPMAVAHS